MSKASLHMTLINMAKDLKQAGVTVAAINPGVVYSQKNLDRGGFPADRMVQVDVAVAGLINEIDKLSLQDTGSFVDYKGNRLAW